MKVYVIIVEVQHAYDENTYRNVDSVHDNKESVHKRLQEIEVENKTMSGSIYGEYETFEVDK